MLYVWICQIFTKNVSIVRFWMYKMLCSIKFYLTSDSNEDSMQSLTRANSQSEWICKLYIIYLMGGGICFAAFSALLSMFYCWLVTRGLNTKKFFYLFRVVWVKNVKLNAINANCLNEFSSLPWNQDTVLGYLGEICFNIVTGEAYLASTSIILFFISMCLHHRAFYHIFRHSVSKINHLDKKRTNKEILCEVIRFHISVKK